MGGHPFCRLCFYPRIESDKAIGDDKLLTADADKCKSVEDRILDDNNGLTSSNKGSTLIHTIYPHSLLLSKRYLLYV